MEPILRPFQMEDLDELHNRDGEKQVPREIILRQAALGPSMTAVVEGRVLGCAGVMIAWPGVGSAWMILSDEAVRHATWITRTVREFLVSVQQLSGLHRIEAVALHESLRNQQWLEVLQFEREKMGVARGFLSDRRDVVRYELVKGA